MKNILFTLAIILGAIALIFISSHDSSAQSSIAERLSGRIVLQVENEGQAWYIHPVDQKRYYLGRPEDAWNIMRHLGLGITNDNLAKIPTYDVDEWDINRDITKYVSGRILLQVEEEGEAWYVSPVNNRRYYMDRPADAFQLMRNLGLGITNSNLSQIEEGELIMDPVLELPIANIDDVTGIQTFHDPSSTDFHTGFDFELPNPTEIYAPIRGEISDIIKIKMSNELWIIDVFIEYNSKWSTFIAFEPYTYDESVIDDQLSQIVVKEGDFVEKGQLLGTLDSVPNSEFPHIHWQVQEDGEPVRPYDYCSESAKALMDILYDRFDKQPGD